jgi:prepilin-type N-terminal cleavage/methylation domain-containing protein
MKINNKRYNQRGFTLIEMIVTIGILGVLAVTAIAVLNPFAQFQKAADSKRKADLSQIQKALESYYEDNQQYPPVIGLQINGISWGSSWQPYMNVIPVDANAIKKYVYYAPPDRQSYYLYASLDRGSKDPQACSGDLCSAPDAAIQMSGPTSACGANENCDFGVTSPNVAP